MKVLTKYRFEVKEHLTKRVIRYSSERNPKLPWWEDVPDPDAVAEVLLYKGKAKKPVYTLKTDPELWQKSLAPVKNGKCALIASFNGEYGVESTYYYLYKGYIYESEIKLDTDEVILLVEQERENREDRLRKQIDRVKARAEAEGDSRAPIKEDVQVLVWNRDGGKCVSCGGNKALEFDHIIPISKGGGDSARNIQLLCETCNRKKGARIGG